MILTGFNTPLPEVTVTGPFAEDTPLEESYTSDDLGAPPDELDDMDDEELFAHSRRLIQELARRAKESRPGSAEGPEAWQHVELLVDLARAEEAQRVVERIVREHRKT